jgi:hypothetical protein
MALVGEMPSVDLPAPQSPDSFRSGVKVTAICNFGSSLRLGWTEENDGVGAIPA